jgi:hypothetical protein
MFLSDVEPIRLGLFGRATLSFVELNYLELGPEQSLYDEAFAEARERAIHDFQTFLNDECEHEHEVRRALLYLLNLDRPRFEQRLDKINMPFPRWAPDDAHRFLVELWQRTWGSWRIESFDPDGFEVTTNDADAGPL